ncbi:MAG: hypothetical protein ACRENX_06245 [Candidatus Dormibacteria bacterium]
MRECLLKRDPTLATCSGTHRDHEACCIKSATLWAAQIPAVFQFPFWGTPGWEETYAKRTNVGRGFSNFKTQT